MYALTVRLLVENWESMLECCWQENRKWPLTSKLVEREGCFQFCIFREAQMSQTIFISPYTVWTYTEPSSATVRYKYLILRGPVLDTEQDPNVRICYTILLTVFIINYYKIFFDQLTVFFNFRPKSIMILLWVLLIHYHSSFFSFTVKLLYLHQISIVHMKYFACIVLLYKQTVSYCVVEPAHSTMARSWLPALGKAHIANNWGEVAPVKRLEGSVNLYVECIVSRCRLWYLFRIYS